MRITTTEGLTEEIKSGSRTDWATNKSVSSTDPVVELFRRGTARLQPVRSSAILVYFQMKILTWTLKLSQNRLDAVGLFTVCRAEDRIADGVPTHIPGQTTSLPTARTCFHGVK